MTYKGYKPEIDESAYIAPSADVIGQVKVKENASIWFGAVLRGDINKITVGKCSNVQDNSTVHVSEDTGTEIGDYVTIGHNCIIHGCKINDYTLIGMGSIILDGAVISENSIVGAGSLVTGNKIFPPGVLILGSPAKVRRKLTEEEIKGLKESANHYVDTANEYKIQ
ncbi:gamma carbonic anhydrase family protein [Vallitalea guaymasensis]|uniref:gamma carbonic anhydrase family protein n=1 Tax=Vallitalea guaymasensis TaxID=1185412 RepID=UPI000DE54E38|nr:gamma carbonic anhydrase family protein [Vallitalea guaymasensis]